MSYYILPKNNNFIEIEPTLQKKPLTPYTSCSLYNFYNRLLTEHFFLITNKCYEDTVKLINPYEFIFSKIPGTKLSISKIPFQTNIFYDFLEINYTLNTLEFIQNKDIKSLHITPNHINTIECMEILRENNMDIHTNIPCIDLNYEFENAFDFIFYEINENNYESINDYVINLLIILKVIIKSQLTNGTCIIKLSTLFYKPIIDIVYLLSSLYEKVYIIKPNTSNIVSYEKYIVCKGFILNEKVCTNYDKYYKQIIFFSNKLNEKSIKNDFFIKSIIRNELPCYFINKIDDINIITGQQQLEAINQIINIIKNKNREIKLENIKKVNIQKCINWCEKYNVPCNKFIEKSNIFLSDIKAEE
jgi:hypothetical protein